MGNALIDDDYFENLWDGGTIGEDKLHENINAVSALFEMFCNRPLKERSYTYLESEEDLETGVYYVSKYTVFDGPNGNTLWLPTYPIDSISHLEISGVEVSEMTGYEADTGYALYRDTGRMVYEYHWDYPYRQNVKIKWKGGYPEGSSEYVYLQYLCFLAIKDCLNAPKNLNFSEERIGKYSYKLASEDFTRFMGLNSKVFNDLGRYRKEAFA